MFITGYICRYDIPNFANMMFSRKVKIPKTIPVYYNHDRTNVLGTAMLKKTRYGIKAIFDTHDIGVQMIALQKGFIFSMYADQIHRSIQHTENSSYGLYDNFNILEISLVLAGKAMYPYKKYRMNFFEL